MTVDKIRNPQRVVAQIDGDLASLTHTQDLPLNSRGSDFSTPVDGEGVRLGSGIAAHVHCANLGQSRAW